MFSGKPILAFHLHRLQLTCHRASYGDKVREFYEKDLTTEGVTYMTGAFANLGWDDDMDILQQQLEADKSEITSDIVDIKKDDTTNSEQVQAEEEEKSSWSSKIIEMRKKMLKDLGEDEELSVEDLTTNSEQIQTEVEETSSWSSRINDMRKKMLKDLGEDEELGIEDLTTNVLQQYSEEDGMDMNEGLVSFSPYSIEMSKANCVFQGGCKRYAAHSRLRLPIRLFNLPSCSTL